MTVETPTKPGADSAPNTGWKPELHEIPLDAIEVGGNVREKVDGLNELTASVRAVGIRTPIRVADIGAGKYELVYGQRRLAAAREAGLTTIPAIVDAEQPDRRDRTVDQLVENLQRSDLNAVDTAKAYRWLLDKGLTQRQLAERLGIAQPTVANTLALLKAPEAIQERVAAGQITRSHVEAIAKLPKAEQEEVARRVVEHKLSVDQVSEEIKLAQHRQAEADRQRDFLARVLPEVAAKVPGILEQVKLEKDAIALIVDNSAALAERLLADGYTIVEKPKTMQSIYGAGTKADPCYESVRLLRWYEHWGTNYPPQLEAVCVDRGHDEARRIAQQKARDAENRRWERENKKRQEEQARARREEAKKLRGTQAGTAAIIGADPVRMQKIGLYVSLAGSRGATVMWFAEEVLKTTELDAVEAEQLWAAIDGLTEHQLVAWRSRLLAEIVLSWPADDPFRELFSRHEGDAPTPAKTAKRKKSTGSPTGDSPTDG